MSSTNGTQTRPGGPVIGYIDTVKGMVYLNVETTIMEVVRHCQHSEPLPVTVSELPQRLHKRGIIAETDIDRKTDGTVNTYTKRVRVTSGQNSKQVRGYMWISTRFFVDNS